MITQYMFQNIHYQNKNIIHDLVLISSFLYIYNVKIG